MEDGGLRRGEPRGREGWWEEVQDTFPLECPWGTGRGEDPRKPRDSQALGQEGWQPGPVWLQFSGLRSFTHFHQLTHWCITVRGTPQPKFRWTVIVEAAHILNSTTHRTVYIRGRHGIQSPFHYINESQKLIGVLLWISRAL